MYRQNYIELNDTSLLRLIMGEKGAKSQSTKHRLTRRNITMRTRNSKTVWRNTALRAPHY